MPDAICDQCETVRHCEKNGCIPMLQLEAPPRARMEVRLEELMRRCREDAHDLCYQDLLELRGAA